MQETPSNGGCITCAQFSRLLRLPLPTNLSKSAALQRDMLVYKFINKLKAAVAARRAAASQVPPTRSSTMGQLGRRSSTMGGGRASMSGAVRLNTRARTPSVADAAP